MSWGCDVPWLITGGIGAVIGAIDGVDAWLSGGSTRDVALGALQGGAIGFVIGATLGYGMPLLSCAGQAAVNAGMLGFGAATTLLGVGDAIQQGNTGLAAWRAGFGLTMLGLGAYGARAGGACFAAGTPLLTPDGAKSVESFQVGDLVLSRHENDPKGPVEAKVVEEVFVRSALMWHVHVGGQVIRSTAEHPFYVEGSGWVACQELKIGDCLLAADGTPVQVEDLLDTGEWETVYNLRIANFHTYFVGSDEWGFSVWAHNATCFHYTSEDGVKGMNGSRTIKASVTGYDKHGVKGSAVFLTPDAPDVVMARGVSKYGLTKEKAKYVVEVEVPDDQIRPVRGGRGEYVWYTTTNIQLPAKGKIGTLSGIE